MLVERVSGQSWCRGFTLIELVVSIGIIGLLLSTGMPAFRSYGSRVSLDNQAQAISQAVNQARTLALAPEADKASEVVAYGLTFALGTGQYEIVRFAENVLIDCEFTQLSVFSTSLLPSELRFTQVPDQIVFPIDGQGEPRRCADMEITVASSRLQHVNARTITVKPVSGQVVITQGETE